MLYDAASCVGGAAATLSAPTSADGCAMRPAAGSALPTAAKYHIEAYIHKAFV